MVDPYYLAAFLASNLGQAQIRQYTTGTAIRGISVGGKEKLSDLIKNQPY
jgi:hypothetical protein